MAVEPGQVIDGKYSILRLIGEGGMGAVYLGENVKIKRKVAIKVLHASTAQDAQVVIRFEREAQAAGTIGNDHILEILDLGQLPEGDRYMVMEYLDGEPLASRIERLGTMTPQQLCPIARQVLDGLAAAHAAGIIHRDLKPDNIFILKEKAGSHDYVKIIDFGISKFQPLGGDAKNMTRTGAIMGTPYYMAPEQARGSVVADARSDLYSVGVILYEALTGRLPFDGNTVNELLFKIVLEPPMPLLEVRPDLDPAFASVVMKAMAREIDARFQTAADFIAALDGWSASGAAVSVPPQAGSPLTTTGQGTAPRTAAAGRRTANSWATSRPAVSVPPAKQSHAAKLAVFGAVGAIVLAGLGVATWKLLGSKTVVANDAPVVVSATSDLTPPAASDPPAVSVEPAAGSEPDEPTPTASQTASVSADVPTATHRTPSTPSRDGKSGTASTATAATKTSPTTTAPPKGTGKSGGSTPDFGY